MTGTLHIALTVLMAPPFASSPLDARDVQVVGRWLEAHPGYRLAVPEDCSCPEDIANMKRGYGGDWVGVPNYHPYVAKGDLNSDRSDDLAVVVLNPSLTSNRFTLLVFNGPIRVATKPAFAKSGLDLTHQGLFIGPPRGHPRRLQVGGFETEASVLYPRGASYELVYDEGE